MFLLSIDHWLYYKLKSLQTAEFPADIYENLFWKINVENNARILAQGL